MKREVDDTSSLREESREGGGASKLKGSSVTILPRLPLDDTCGDVWEKPGDVKSTMKGSSGDDGDGEGDGKGPHRLVAERRA